MAFDINNYQEKYRWTGKDTQNRAVQLRIYQRTSTPQTLTAIRGLIDIKLQVQGSSEPAYAPIVKTSLMFTLVDAPDLATAGEKSGNWQEFYTPDSTLYLVVLYRNGLLTWRGYITPDSWRESLAYRGAITITARDNLGHLQDIPFDGAGNNDGLIQVSQLVTDALDVIDFPMQLDNSYNTGDAQTLRDSHGLLIDGYVAVSELQEDSWYDALEKVLIATGYSLRYVGGATEKLAPIRNIPLGSYSSRANALGQARVVEFYGGDRELDPAVRQITEKVDFGAEMEIDLDPRFKNAYTGGYNQTYSGTYIQPSLIPTSFNGRSWKHTNPDYATKGGWAETRGHLNLTQCVPDASLEAIDAGLTSEMGIYLAASQASDGSITPVPTFRTKANSTDVTLRLEFASSVYLKNAAIPFSLCPFIGWISAIKLCFTYTTPGGQVYSCKFADGKGSWAYGPWYSPASFKLAEEYATSFAVDIPLPPLPTGVETGGWLDIEFYNIEHVGLAPTIYGLFARLTGIKATLNAKSVLKSDNVTTVNNTAYNVKLERKPEFGAMSAQVPWINPANYPNAFWAYNGTDVEPLDYAAYLNGYASTTAIPLPAQIHKQMLCYCYTPLEVLGGNCGTVNKAQLLNFGQLATYKGKDYIIQGGTLDVLQNRISGVVLHEFAWYADMWDENNNPSYSGTPKYETDSTLNGANGNSAIASSPGGGGGGGGGTVTSVGLAAPTGLQVTGSPITTSGTIQLSLASGYEIPLTADVNEGKTAFGWGDHADAGYLKTAADIAAALGYVPANGSAESLQRPRLQIASGWENRRNPTVMTPVLQVSHPLLDANINAEAVLMIWRKRRCRSLEEDPVGFKIKPHRRAAWGEARGASATATALTFGKSVALDTLRLRIINNYVCVYGSALPTSMTLAQFYALTSADTPRFGRIANYTGTDTDYKSRTKGRELFGIAIRIPNPAFAAKVVRPLAETTREIDGVPRYIYTDIAPLVVQITDSAITGRGYDIGFDCAGRLK